VLWGCVLSRLTAVVRGVPGGGDVQRMVKTDRFPSLLGGWAIKICLIAFGSV
jgi:hypothetical protein